LILREKFLLLKAYKLEGFQSSSNHKAKNIVTSTVAVSTYSELVKHIHGKFTFRIKVHVNDTICYATVE
jgi:4-hydroxy-3-methylbut-2-enyl diphosphate reductase IspH